MDKMSSRAVIEKLAKQKLEAAKCLLEKNHYDDAYYLAGYCVELCLKAAICKTLDIDNFFECNKLSKKENYRAFKSHCYKDLLILSGLESVFDVAAKQDPHLTGSWSVVGRWNETSRYDCDQDPDEVKKFIKSSEIICSWIQKHL